MKKRVSFLILFIISLAASAQTSGYHYYCVLDSVKTSGFCSVNITPEISSYLKTDYSDLRLVNDSGRWIPHLLRFSKDEYPRGLLPVEMEMRKPQTSGNLTTVVVENKGGFISSFSFLIKNTDAVRSCSISGSDDEKTWYALKDSAILQSLSDAPQYHFTFPSCNYRFFRVIIDNKKNDPVNILSATTLINTLNFDFPSGRLVNPATVLKQTDSAKISCIKVEQQKPYHFENIKLFVSGAKFFFRKAELYIPASETFNPAAPGFPVLSFYISNNSALSFDLPLTNSKRFYIIIYNADNPPLKIDSVQTMYNQRFITAYLENSGQYRLILNNKDAVLPDYDIQRLNIPTPDTSYILKTGVVRSFAPEKITGTPPEKSNKLLLWSVIILILCLLLSFTSGMLKETNKKNDDHL